MVQSHFIENDVTYTGSELVPHWIYKNYDMVGDAIVAFIGRCEVNFEHMVDLADVKAQSPIYSPRMLNFIVEFFDNDLETAIYRQRILVVIIKEYLENKSIPGKLLRSGDDLYLVNEKGEMGKLTVSIATRSQVSTLIHTGINVETEGTPVKTAGLKQLDVDPVEMAGEVMKAFKEEIEGVRVARSKVRPV